MVLKPLKVKTLFSYVNKKGISKQVDLSCSWIEGQEQFRHGIQATLIRKSHGPAG